MEKNSDGGPAFPCDGMDNGPENFKGRPSDGMTLRDYFAAQALPSLITAIPSLTKEKLKKFTPAEACAISAYDYADEMLKARGK